MTVLVPGNWSWTGFIADLAMGLENLRQHKLRAFLTMLGMIFGVAAVVSMLSIGAGAQQHVMAFIEQLGVRNLIVEARESTDWDVWQKVRKTSPGLTFRDRRAILAAVEGLEMSSARKRFTPAKVLPKAERDIPVVYGVSPNYQTIGAVRVVAGRFFDEAEAKRAETVCVLGQAAKETLFGAEEAVGAHVKVNEQWLRVIGVAGGRVNMEGGSSGAATQDSNNIIYAPIETVILRMEDAQSGLRDEIDGLYLRLKDGADSAGAADVVRRVLDVSHRGEPDYSVVVPAQLLAEQKKTQRVFEYVMVALASISLLVGGIGIMNIMLASILERTREIGIRRALGARRADIVRQFLVEATLISLVGGSIGVLVGVSMSRLIALLAGWSTIVTLSSVLLAFAVSVTVGLVFGLFPATKAAALDPVEAIRYE
jgi:putative ABC transport system permease protein